MKILVVTTGVPFVYGGAQYLFESLVAKLREHGHEVDGFSLPFESSWTSMVPQLLALRFLKFSESGDRMIAIRPPSHLPEHPNKVLWFIHHQREAYDLWGTEYQGGAATAENLVVRNAVIQADQQAFAQSTAIFTNSRTVSNRLREFNGVESEVLYPPLWRPEACRNVESGDYIFYVSRVTGIKRQILAIEAMAHVKSSVRLVLAGQAVTDADRKPILQALSKCPNADRIQWLDHWISDKEKFELMSRAAACLYIPFNEDSYGYVALEAFHCGKPVITCTDSGGALELVEDGVSGFVVEPSPQALAHAMDRIYENKSKTADMSAATAPRLEQLKISWDHVVARLLA